MASEAFCLDAEVCPTDWTVFFRRSGFCFESASVEDVSLQS